jgi:CRISPR-associated protein Cmr6
MSSANIGWLFYKDYFNGLNYSDLGSKKNKDIINENVQNIILQTPKIEELNEDDMLGNIHFKATTTYPGLLLGSGNAHELPSIEGQAILGFHFDYTSGLPVIQGSSIKGVLRSAFKHHEYIKELLKDENIDVGALEKEIFHNGDVFHDAVIIKADSLNKILGDDFLCPHGDNPLKNPIPLRFIKVLPNVTFRFDFELSDGLIEKSKKSKLFEEILKDLGLGAKTNVGYGKFGTFTTHITMQEKALQKQEEENKKQNARDKAQDEANDREDAKQEKLQRLEQELQKLTDLDLGLSCINKTLDKNKPTAEQALFIKVFFDKNKKNKKYKDKTIKKFEEIIK